MENTIKPNKAFDSIILILKILYIVAYALFTAFLVWQLISAYGNSPENSVDFALVLSLIIIIIGTIGNAILCGVGVVGVILSVINKRSLKRKFNVIFFTVATFLPAITELSLIGIASLL